MRVLVLSAAIGEGHDVPARQLAADLLARRPGAHVPIVDGLNALGPLLERIGMGASSFDSTLHNHLFDLNYVLVSRWAPSRRFSGRAMVVVGGRRLLALIARERPDVIVSTYPGVTEVLGRLRRSGRLDVPVVSAITDLSALRWWAHPGVDLHLVTHPESIPEVLAVAGAGARVVPVRNLDDPRFATPPPRADARRALQVADDERLVVVSGGGWGVGDLTGAIDVALARPDARVVVMCGRNDELRASLTARYGEDREAVVAGRPEIHGGPPDDRPPRVRPIGFTTEVPQLFAAADALVHSTAGLTVLEAWALGCPVISYGWGRAHIRANNRAFAEHGIAAVAGTRAELARELDRALAVRGSAVATFAALPVAADVVLAFAGDHVGDRG